MFSISSKSNFPANDSVFTLRTVIAFLGMYLDKLDFLKIKNQTAPAIKRTTDTAMIIIVFLFFINSIIRGKIYFPKHKEIKIK
jgi:hypothetical protein